MCVTLVLALAATLQNVDSEAESDTSVLQLLRRTVDRIEATESLLQLGPGVQVLAAKGTTPSEHLEDKDKDKDKDESMPMTTIILIVAGVCVLSLFGGLGAYLYKTWGDSDPYMPDESSSAADTQEYYPASPKSSWGQGAKKSKGVWNDVKRLDPEQEQREAEQQREVIHSTLYVYHMCSALFIIPYV